MEMLPWSVVLLCALGSVRGSSVSPSALQPPLTRVRFIHVEDDYEDQSSKATLAPQSPGVTASRAIPRPCDYDPCAVETTSCDTVAARTGCLCPGLTGPEEKPKAPELREVKLDDSGTMSVHWCAPRSTVTYYEVTGDGGSKQHVFGGNLRSGALPGMKVGETVCVAAGNQAGVGEKSCAYYQPPRPPRAGLMAGVIAGSVGFLLLLLVLAVVLWRRRTCRKGRTGEGEGLGNPSYTTDGVN